MLRALYVVTKLFHPRRITDAFEVKFATTNNISFLATGGRHGYTTTYKNLHNGLAIDLSRLDTLEVNKTAGTLTVGPGVTLGEVIDPLFQAGFDIREFRLSGSDRMFLIFDANLN